MSGPLVQALEKRRQEDLAKTQPLTPGTLEWAWAQAQKPFKGYWDRQGLMAREGLAMADQGAQQVRQGDLSGLAGMAFGPLNYLSSPINALFPIEEAQTQLPKEVSPFVAGGLELMALAAPGPKGGKMRKVADAAEEGITAYHGSPHTFDKFDMSKIGTGEGAQAYGHGLYFAENPQVAEVYKYVHGGGAPGAPDVEAFRYRGNEVSGITGTSAPDFRPAGTGNPLDVDGLRKFPPSETSASIQNFGVGATPAKLKHIFPDYSDDEIAALQALINAKGDGAKAASFLTGKGKAAAAKIATENADQFEILEKANPGRTYQVRLNVKPDELLDWDRPLSEQPIAERTKEILKSSGIEAEVKQVGLDPMSMTGEGLHGWIKDPKQATKATEQLKAAGIKGIRYKDPGSRSSEGGTYNYVIFDDKLVDILKRYAIPFTLGAGGAAIVSGQDMPPEVASQLGPQA